MTSGLWRYTRHPDIFGEALSWWGIYLISCGTPGGGWTIYSAITITYDLMFISGVAFIERKKKKTPEFRVYMYETSAFIPFFYTQYEGKQRKKLL